jgi:Zn-dependent protease
VKLLMSFAAVMTGFLLHELAHKWMAQKYGCWAEYRGNRKGLLLALLMGAVGFLIAAPGAVMVAGHVTNRQHGHIAAVGPLTNIALALAALPFYLLLANAAGPLGWAGALAQFLVIINLILGGFNMIPVPPLDGSKIMAWSNAAWGAILAAILALAMVYWTIMPF